MTLTPGTKHNALMLIAKTGDKWRALCDCGTLLNVTEHQVLSDEVISCDCTEPLPSDTPLTPISKHPGYVVWQNMKSHCYTQTSYRYPEIGAKGIKVGAYWLKSPKAFVVWLMDNDWMPGRHLVRKDPNRNYSPSNCEVLSINESRYRQNVRNSHQKCVGVTYQPRGANAGMWLARITANGIKLYLGWYTTLFDAACARRSAERRVHLAKIINADHTSVESLITD